MGLEPRGWVDPTYPLAYLNFLVSCTTLVCISYLLYTHRHHLGQGYAIAAAYALSHYEYAVDNYRPHASPWLTRVPLACIS